MTQRIRRHLALAAAAAALVLWPSPAAAKNSKTFTYSYAQVWSTAVRLVRADEGYRITDKDRETGYILFVFPGKGSVKTCAASMEVVPFVDDQGYHRIRVQLTIAHQPSYVALHLLDKLDRKLAEEQGDPPPPRKAEKKKPKKNDKKGGDRDSDKGTPGGETARDG